MTSGAVAILKKTNKAEIQESRIERSKGSAGSYARHNFSNCNPDATDGRSLG